MIDTLNSYLAQHKSISIPGVGTIYIETHSAHTAEKQQVLPPAFVYRFDKFRDIPVKDFFLFIAEQKKIPEYEAIRLYSEFAAEFRADIDMKEEVVWKNAGVFKKDASGEIGFEELAGPFALFAPVTAEKTIEQNTVVPVASAEEVLNGIPEYRESHNTTGEGRMKTWWLYALVLFAVAVVVLWIHFYNKGVIWQAFFNQQPVY